MTDRQEIERLQTSTRERDDLRSRLQRWLAGVYPAGADPVVSELDSSAANGMSSETLLFDVTLGDGATEALVARVEPDPAAMPVFPAYDLPAQFRILEELGSGTGVPVPRVRWLEPAAEALGAPFFVMDRVEGRVPPDVMPYNTGSWVSEAPVEDQRRLQESTVAVLAALHDVDASRFDFLAGGGLRRLLAAEQRYYTWVADGVPHPVIERALRWLGEHLPDDEGPAVLSWGDARIGNVIYRDFEPAAVLDWEMAALGPRELDLAWFVVFHRMFEEVAETYGLPSMPDFCRRDDVLSQYERLTGWPARHFEWHAVFAAVRQALAICRARRRSVHFGEAEMPDDPDDLIMHRPMLDRMVAGTSW
jgi:aminoglycoside phosphotransferase (APT) family kinase protein